MAIERLEIHGSVKCFLTTSIMHNKLVVFPIRAVFGEDDLQFYFFTCSMPAWIRERNNKLRDRIEICRSVRDRFLSTII